MNTLLYDELAPFYHLLDPLVDHNDEGQEFGVVLTRAVPHAQTLLELGSGAGHGAYFIKKLFTSVTLSDLSPAMLSRSRALNPDCEHVDGDMRSLRLNRVFDCVLIHDAIAYLTSETELLATATTVFEHLRAGGAALLIPDCVKETFRESYEIHVGNDDRRSLRCISWSYDPSRDDSTHLVDFAFLLREGDGEVRAVHDRHSFGLFETDTWTRTLGQAGLSVEVIARPLPPEFADTAYTDKMFLCRKP